MGAAIFFAPKEAWFRPYIAARTGALLFSMKGVPTMLFPSTSQTFASFLNTVAAGASIEVYGSVRLRAEASVGVSAAPPVVRLDGREIDRLGLPIALFRIGPEVTF
jgi:hypothetical protein